ncbi:MAG: methylenetetrahydrofolate reductase [Holophagales bacterium]|nr:methylenetetrahydrofolate reductase [Holophagales bacterium]
MGHPVRHAGRLPGLRILDKKRQLRSIPRTFHCEIPPELVDAVEKASGAKEVKAAGVEWALAQAQELIDRNVPSVHFYIMQSSASINALLKKLKL